jgi:hypothetical protein
MLRVREDVGRAISHNEAAVLLEMCRASRSRSLYPAVLLALNTCVRYSEIRLLRWEQIDLKSCTLTVGLSKTESGTGRVLPLNDRAVAILGFWASLFPVRERNHFVFPSERCGASGDGVAVVYDCDPTKPIGRWKEAWESAKLRAGVSCRFHDLRHTGCTRMLEAGVPFSVVATIITRKGPVERVGVVVHVKETRSRLMIPDTVFLMRVLAGSQIMPAFLPYALGSTTVQSDWFQKKIGLADAQVNLNHSILRATIFHKPGPDEQQLIVARAEKISQQTYGDLSRLRKLGSLKTALMQDLLTGKKGVTPLLEPEATH